MTRTSGSSNGSDEWSRKSIARARSDVPRIWRTGGLTPEGAARSAFALAGAWRHRWLARSTGPYNPPLASEPPPPSLRDAARGSRAGRPRSAEVKRVPNAAMPGGEVLPLLGAGVGEALPLLGADVGDVCADAHGCFLVGPADPKAARFTDVSAS